MTTEPDQSSASQNQLSAGFERWIRYSFVRYLLIGGTTFGLDFGLLLVLHEGLGLQVLIAASISYWVSISYNFILNRKWTFEAGGSQLQRHALMYGLLLGFNYLFTIGFIALAQQVGVNYGMAKVLTVALCMIWNFLVYKHFIFR